MAIHQDTGYEAMEAVAAEQKYDWGGGGAGVRVTINTGPGTRGPGTQGPEDPDS